LPELRPDLRRHNFWFKERQLMIMFRLALAMFFIISMQAVGQTTGQKSLWLSSTTPGLPQVTSSASVTLGLKFYSDVAGSITGVRFYKASRNTGTHTGALWSATGAKLASVTFSGETASGWQQAKFSSPVTISANTTYVISYTAPYGAHAHDQYYRWSSVSAAPLHVSGSAPGVYTYGSGVLFPKSAFNNSNYWVDVIFSPTGTTPPPDSGQPAGSYTISGVVRGAAATLTLSGAASRSTSTNGSGNYSFTNLPNGNYIVAPSNSGYTFGPTTYSVKINGASNTSVNFVATPVAAPVPHTVTLSWKASTSSNLKGYHVYRAAVAGGAFTKLTASPVSTTAYTDSSVASGRTYYYVTTSVDSNNTESGYSNQATAVIPTP
jgi:hypothetical protein